MATGSRIVEWSDSFCIGLPEIDDQHRTLVDLMNDLWVAITANAPTSESERILERLEQYTIAHFGAEETMMRTLDYPDFDTHRHAHEQFVKRLQSEKSNLQNGKKPGLDILHFLRDWLVNHILVNDKAYANYYAGRNKPAGVIGRFFSRFKMA